MVGWFNLTQHELSFVGVGSHPSCKDREGVVIMTGSNAPSPPPPSSVTYGDADGNGSFGMSDLNTVVDWILGRKSKPSSGSTAFIAADVDGNGSIGMSDLNLFVDKLLGRITKFPVE